MGSGGLENGLVRPGTVRVKLKEKGMTGIAG